uniref:SHSP domain-containing protein n=1 Tax=Panagrellus redivivus TaxID=6233 RepID=A0A7E5A123_PANRE
MAVEVSHSWNANNWDWPLQHHDGVVKVNNTDEKFEVGLDASFFTPKEIEVKIAGDKLVVQFRHENRDDIHGTVAREINRTYALPPDVDKATLKSHLTSRGVLNITAQKKHH